MLHHRYQAVAAPPEQSMHKTRKISADSTKPSLMPAKNVAKDAQRWVQRDWEISKSFLARGTEKGSITVRWSEAVWAMRKAWFPLHI